MKAFNLEKLVFRSNYIGKVLSGGSIGAGYSPEWERYRGELMDIAPGAPRPGERFNLKEVLEFMEEDNVWENEGQQ